MAGNGPNVGDGSFRLTRELVGLGALFLAVYTCVALYTYSSVDPGFNQVVAAKQIVVNKAGRVGAYWGGFLAEYLGVWGYLVPGLIAWRGLRFLAPRLALPFRRSVGLALLVLVVLIFLGSAWGEAISVGRVYGGGQIGHVLFELLNSYLSVFGAVCLLLFGFIAAMQFLFDLTLDNFWRPLAAVVNDQFWRIGDAFASWRERRAAAREAQASAPDAADTAPKPVRAARPKKAEPAPAAAAAAAAAALEDAAGPSEAVDRFLDAVVEQVAGANASKVPGPAKPAAAAKPEDAPVLVPGPTPKPVMTAKQAIKAGRAAAASGDMTLPPLDLLSVPPAAEMVPADPAICRGQAESLITCLNDFGIQGEVTRVVPGPVVTMFEVKPAPGVKISRIVGLSVDLALSMKALAVRIDPIPGKDTVGVEIPNAKRQTVYFREILDADVFRASASRLTLAIGKDIQGRPHVADLARMPHLLVAGATGSGKSVCINGILLSILYKATPDEVKLLLVDPKRIELSVYNDLPHLVHPVVTETAMAKSALDWAVAEMDRRYEAMALLGVRNIASYNEKLEKLGDAREPELAELEPLPYLVIVIDELADLMMTAAKEVEVSIVRLAQLARAGGIHLILATQRPSVDVVTGLIKANFPTRISFQVTSKHDSRTILDAVGAEYLLGRGDMLYKPSGGKTVRMHGAFVSDEETAAVVEFWKSKAAPSYKLDFSEWQKGGDGAGGDLVGDGGDDTASDAVYPQAVDFVMEQGKASISLIQRRFRIGFNRAARFIEQMERDGLLGPQEGSKPRSVIRNKD
ncbi:DNA translocase FtsK [Desulfovibrio aerotolerans]|uniref:DNA translocase FtsK n=1 Tax=Solidesulfovibrio aerotolerans TaxID=295255 RepID=A0A7C9MJZ3_9BACT|nr:DNA translocase FtsK [Solidesulfovibrio aerotolerans]MYL84248.1 DNA translocase FtsK [Solidesulfovibrio aerotolerans]